MNSASSLEQEEIWGRPANQSRDCQRDRSRYQIARLVLLSLWPARANGPPKYYETQNVGNVGVVDRNESNNALTQYIFDTLVLSNKLLVLPNTALLLLLFRVPLLPLALLTWREAPDHKPLTATTARAAPSGAARPPLDDAPRE